LFLLAAGRFRLSVEDASPADEDGAAAGEEGGGDAVGMIRRACARPD